MVRASALNQISITCRQWNNVRYFYHIYVSVKFDPTFVGPQSSICITQKHSAESQESTYSNSNHSVLYRRIIDRGGYDDGEKLPLASSYFRSFSMNCTRTNFHFRQKSLLSISCSPDEFRFICPHAKLLSITSSFEISTATWPFRVASKFDGIFFSHAYIHVSCPCAVRTEQMLGWKSSARVRAACPG